MMALSGTERVRYMLLFGLPTHRIHFRIAGRNFRGVPRPRPIGIWNVVDTSSGQKDFRTKETQHRQSSALRKGTSVKKCERCFAETDEVTPVTLEFTGGEQKEMRLCPKCLGDAFSISTNSRFESPKNVPKRSWWQFWK